MNSSTKKIITTVLKCLLSVGILWYIIYKFDIKWTKLSELISQPIWIGAALFLSLVVATFLANNRWKTFLAMIGVHESFWRLVLLNWKSLFYGVWIPSSQGYDVIRIYNIEKAHPESRGKVGSTVIVERLIGLVCLISIAFVALIFIGDEGLIWPIMILVAVVGIVLFVIRNKRCAAFINRILSNSRFMPRAANYLLKLYNGLHDFPFDKRLIVSVVLILLLQLNNILIVDCLFRACGCEISIVYHLLYQPVVSVITMIPITFGGVGLREGGFAYFYSQLSVDGATVVAVSLAYYCIMTLLPALIGAVVNGVEMVKRK